VLNGFSGTPRLLLENPLFQIGSEMNEQLELTETVTPRDDGSRNPRPVHGFADCGPILGVIALNHVQGYIESLGRDPLTKEEVRDFVSLSRIYDRCPTFSEIIEEVRLTPQRYPRSSDATHQFRYLFYDNPSDLGEILDVITLDEVEQFLSNNGHAPLTEAERFCFAFYFVGAPTLHWVDEIVTRLRPEIGQPLLSADARGLPQTVVGVDGELHIEEIDRAALAGVCSQFNSATE